MGITYTLNKPIQAHGEAISMCKINVIGNTFLRLIRSKDVVVYVNNNKTNGQVHHV